jgi:hypothetical protein
MCRLCKPACEHWCAAVHCSLLPTIQAPENAGSRTHQKGPVVHEGVRYDGDSVDDGIVREAGVQQFPGLAGIQGAEYLARTVFVGSASPMPV